MANPNSGSVYSAASPGKTVFIDTNLGTHLVTVLHNGDTVFTLKKRLRYEHQLCFPDVGNIEISALKVKRRGHLYHLSDTMCVVKAFEGISKSWFLFLEASKVVKEGENLHLQCIDSSKQVKYFTEGVEPLLVGPSKRLSDIDEVNHQHESDRQLVVYMSGADKQHQTDFDMKTERSAGNHPDVPPETHAVKNVVFEYQKDSVADHNSSNPKLLEKEKDGATSSGLVDRSIRNEVKDVEQYPNPEVAAGTELTKITKRTRKSKRKTRSSDDHAPETIEPSGVSALTSATSAHENTVSKANKESANVDGNGNVEFEHCDSAALVAIEPSITVRENADIHVNSVEAEGDISGHKNGKIVVGNDIPVKETSSIKTPAKKRRKVEKKPGKEDSVAGTVESIVNTNKTVTKPDVIVPLHSLLDRPKVSNLDAAEIANDHLEAGSGLTASPIADKKKKQKKSSKYSNTSAAATTSSRDPLDGNHGGSGNADCAIFESCAISTREKLDEPLTAVMENETEMGVENVGDAVGSRVAILSAADSLQTADFTSTPLLLVHKSKKPDLIGNNSDQNLGHKEKNATSVLEVANLGSVTTKDDGEATANKDNCELNADETKGSKSSKRKRKLRNTKTPVEDTPVNTAAQHVEGSGIGMSSTEPVKVADGGEGPDRVIRNVLDTLQQITENEENLEKVEKKSRKKSKKKQILDAVDGQGLSVHGNNAVEEAAPIVSINDLKEMGDSSKPLKKAKPGKTSTTGQSNRTISEYEIGTAVESDDPLLSKKKTEVYDLLQDTMSHKLNGYGEDKPSNQDELLREKEKEDMGENFDYASDKKLDQFADGTGTAEPGAKSNKKKKKKKTSDMHPEGSIDGSQSSMKTNEKHGSSRRAQPAKSSTSQISSKVKNYSDASLQTKDLERFGAGANNDVIRKVEKDSKALIPDATNTSAVLPTTKMKEAHFANVNEGIQPNTADPRGQVMAQLNASVKSITNKKQVVKSFSIHLNKNKPKDREKNKFPISGAIFDNSNSEEDEPMVSAASTKTPSNASSDYTDEDSDATFMSQKHGSRVFGGESNGETIASSGRNDMSLEKILRSSSRFKKAKLTASQSQPDSCGDEDEVLPFDCVPDSQAN